MNNAQAVLFAEPEAPLLRIDCGDAVAWLRSLPPASVDLFVTDYAYESLEKHRAHGTTTRLTADWFEIFPNDRLPALLVAMHRVMKRDTHLYMLCDQETMHVLHDLNQRSGLFTWWKALIWDKQSIGMGYHWRARHEVVCFLEKGERRLNNLGLPDVLSVKSVRGRGGLSHLCQCEDSKCEDENVTPRDTFRSGCQTEVGGSNIVLSGNSTTDQSLKECRSTTRTRSESTAGASCETACGGSHVETAELSSRSPSNTGTSIRTDDGPSSAAVDRAKYEPLSSERSKSGSNVCLLCQKPRKPWPTEKPVELLRMLIENSSAPGEVVADPFCGSGSCGEAALLSGRKFWGNDLKAEAVAAARARCEALIGAGQR